MADVVTSQKISDSLQHVVYSFTNLSDGTGESAVLKVDVSGLVAHPQKGACTKVAIEQIIYDVQGMVVKLLWDADTDVTAYILASGPGEACFPVPIHNNAGAGVTGDILLTTSGHTSGDSYSIYLKLRKYYG